MTKILDCTTRDGGHSVNWNFSDGYVEDLIQKLNADKISFYEIGYRNHYDNAGKGRFYNCTPDFMEKFYKIKGNLSIGVMTDTTRFSAEDFPDSEDDFVDFVRIACHPDRIKETLNIAELLHFRGYKIFVHLMEVSNIDEKGYIDLCTRENKSFIESLYFADSYGVLQPDDVEHYYNKLKSLGYKNISFHGHNKIQTALANSLKIMDLGGYSIDVSRSDGGRNGGNLNYSELKSAINSF